MTKKTATQHVSQYTSSSYDQCCQASLVETYQSSGRPDEGSGTSSGSSTSQPSGFSTLSSAIISGSASSLDPYTWWCSIVVRTLVLVGELSLSCARLLGAHFVGKASAISQPTRPTQPAIPPG